MTQAEVPLEQAIENWNKKAKEAQKESWEGKNNDYKNMLDEIFRGAGKNYYKGRDFEPTTRERSIDSYDRSKDNYYKDRYPDRYEDKEARH